MTVNCILIRRYLSSGNSCFFFCFGRVANYRLFLTRSVLRFEFLRSFYCV